MNLLSMKPREAKDEFENFVAEAGTAVSAFNPKAEIKVVKMWQDVGAETPWKNRSHILMGLARFFQGVSAQEIAAD